MLFFPEPLVGKLNHASKYLDMYFLRTRSFFYETTGKLLNSRNLTGNSIVYIGITSIFSRLSAL